MTRPPIERMSEAAPVRANWTGAELLALILAVTLVWAPLFEAGQTRPAVRIALSPGAPSPGVPEGADRVEGNPAQQQGIAGQPWSVALQDIRITDALLVLIGLAQAILLRRQAAIARNQVDIAERQIAMTEALERPLMLVSSFRWQADGWKTQADKRSFPVVTIGLSNHGRGLAIVDFCSCGLVIGSTQPIRRVQPQNFMAADTRGDDDLPRRVIYVKHFPFSRGMPGGRDEWTLETSPHDLTPAQMDELGTGHQQAWIDGEVRYRDIGGRPYETHFRFVYDRNAGIFTPDDNAPDLNRHT